MDPLVGFTATARSRGKTPTTLVLESSIVPASPALARQLLVPPNDDVISLVRLRLVDGVPVTVQQSWLPGVRVPGMLARELANRSLFAMLREYYGIIPSSADVTIGARLANQRERELLQLDDPGVVLTIDTVNYDQDGRPIELCLDVVHPQRYQLNLTQRAIR